ncbi:uncharacterized protein LOC110719163 [Chenopodium quinoa]|uniref:uncharacterized protein LOC110719163 n=1 Tax=Chenopodium quinoa TaxID=63459 RepID=UPI000B7845F7|nr:uncharacterized protein LOC110719163 [Chenopodium quinoa]
MARESSVDPTTILRSKLAKSIWFHKTTREIWKDLEDRFGQTSATQLYSLQQELIDMKQVTQKMLKNQQDQTLIMIFMKLDDKLSMVRTHVLLMQPLPTIGVAHRLCMQEERPKEVSQIAAGSGIESMAFAVDRKRFYDRHTDKGYRQNTDNARNTRNAYQNFSGKKARDANLAMTDSEENDENALMENQIHNTNGKGQISVNQYKYFSRQWVIDSGATDHICHDLRIFESYELMNDIDNTITIPDGKRVKVIHIGTGQHLNQTLVLGKLRDGLYCTEVQQSNSVVGKLEEVFNKHAANVTSCNSSLKNKDKEETKLWHLRFGFVYYQKCLITSKAALTEPESYKVASQNQN